MKHTQGPWTVIFRLEHAGQEIYHTAWAEAEVDYIVAHAPDTGCECCVPVVRDSPQDEIAALRAERDSLRAALQRTLSWMTSYPGEGTLGPQGPYEQARAALAGIEPGNRVLEPSAGTWAFAGRHGWPDVRY